MKKSTLNLAKSILVIVLLASLITAGTLAIFTSSVSINDNVVTAGTVKIGASFSLIGYQSLEDDEAIMLPTPRVPGNDPVTFSMGGTVGFNDTGKSIVMTNVVPGDTAHFNLTIENKSNVKIKYSIVLSLLNKDLLSAVDFNLIEELGLEEVSTSEGTYTTGWSEWQPSDADNNIDETQFSVGINYSAGNEFQGLSLEFSLAVYAVQANATSNVVFAASADEINNAANEGANQTIILTNDITSATAVSIVSKANIDLGGHSIVAPTIAIGHPTYAGTILIENGVLKATAEETEFALNVAYPKATVTLNNFEGLVHPSSTMSAQASSNTLVLGSDVLFNYFYTVKLNGNDVEKKLPAAITLKGETKLELSDKFETALLVVAIDANAEGVKVVNKAISKVVVATPPDYAHEVGVVKADNNDVLVLPLELKHEVTEDGNVIIEEIVLDGNNIKSQTTTISEEGEAVVDGDVIAGSVGNVDELLAMLGNAANGAVITLPAGTFNLSQTLVLSKPVTIRGANHGVEGYASSRKAETIFTSASNIAFVQIMSSNVTIDGIKFDGGNVTPVYKADGKVEKSNIGITMVAPSVSTTIYHDVYFKNSIFTKFSTQAINVAASKTQVPFNIVAEHNLFVDNNNYRFVTEAVDVVGENSCAVYVSGAGAVAVKNNRFVNNALAMSYQGGELTRILGEKVGGIAVTAFDEISNNTFIDNTAGIRINTMKSALRIVDNTFTLTADYKNSDFYKSYHDVNITVKVDPLDKKVDDKRFELELPVQDLIESALVMCFYSPVDSDKKVNSELKALISGNEISGYNSGAMVTYASGLNGDATVEFKANKFNNCKYAINTTGLYFDKYTYSDDNTYISIYLDNEYAGCGHDYIDMYHYDDDFLNLGVLAAVSVVFKDADGKIVAGPSRSSGLPFKTPDIRYSNLQYNVLGWTSSNTSYGYGYGQTWAYYTVKIYDKDGEELEDLTFETNQTSNSTVMYWQIDQALLKKIYEDYDASCQFAIIAHGSEFEVRPASAESAKYAVDVKRLVNSADSNEVIYIMTQSSKNIYLTTYLSGLAQDKTHTATFETIGINACDTTAKMYTNNVTEVKFTYTQTVRTYNINLIPNKGDATVNVTRSNTQCNANVDLSNPFGATANGLTFLGWATSTANAQAGIVTYKATDVVQNVYSTLNTWGAVATVNLYAVWGTPAQ